LRRRIAFLLERVSKVRTSLAPQNEQFVGTECLAISIGFSSSSIVIFGQGWWG
jgi:hypothetical protein